MFITKFSSGQQRHCPAREPNEHRYRSLGSTTVLSVLMKVGGSLLARRQAIVSRLIAIGERL